MEQHKWIHLAAKLKVVTDELNKIYNVFNHPKDGVKSPEQLKTGCALYYLRELEEILRSKYEQLFYEFPELKDEWGKIFNEKK